MSNKFLEYMDASKMHSSDKKRSGSKRSVFSSPSKRSSIYVDGNGLIDDHSTLSDTDLADGNINGADVSSETDK